MNKPVYLGLSIQDLSKTAIYEFCCDCIKPKYGEKENCVICLHQLHYRCKNKIFTKILEKMLKQDFALQIMKLTSAYGKKMKS